MQGENGKSRKRNAYTIAIILLLLVAIIGGTYAAFRKNITGDLNKISSGNISMSYLEPTDAEGFISISNALPMDDTTAKSLTGTNEKFDFSVSTSASGSPGIISYSIAVSKPSDDDSFKYDDGYTSLLDDQIKLYLTKLDGSREVPLMSPVLASDVLKGNTVGTIPIDSDKTSYLSHNHNQDNKNITSKFRFRMWIDKDVNSGSWTKDTKLQYKLKLSVNGNLEVK